MLVSEDEPVYFSFETLSDSTRKTTPYIFLYDMLILYSCDKLRTVTQLLCCPLLSGLSIYLFQVAAGIKLHDLFLFRESHQRTSGNVISGLKKTESENTYREMHLDRHTHGREKNATEIHQGRDSGVLHHGNHVKNVVSNSRQCLRAVSNCVS